MLDGKTIHPGDVVIGLEASGLHTNGYSLARKIFFEQKKLKPSSHVTELGNTLGDELLKVHRSYGLLIQALLKKFNKRLSGSPSPPSGERVGVRGLNRPHRIIKGIAHITVGGFVDNIPRV